MALDFDHIFALTSDAAFVSVGHMIVEANEAARELYGVASTADLVGRSIDDLAPPEYRDSLRRRTRTTEEGRGRDRETLEEILRDDGTRVPVLVRSCPIDHSPGPGADPSHPSRRALLVMLRPLNTGADVERRLRRREARSSMFTDVSLRLAKAGESEVDATIEEVLGLIATSEGADRAYINLYHADDPTVFSCGYEWCGPGIEQQRDYVQRLSTTSFPWSNRILTALDVVHVPDLHALPPEAVAERESFGLYAVRSVLEVPLVVGGVLIGQLGFNSVTHSVWWSDDTIELVRGVCDAIATAITRRDALHAMQQAREEAEQANAAKDLFLSRMSHELRTPLNAVLGFTELLLLDHTRDESDRAALEQVRDSGRHLLALVEDVLDISRIEAGRLSMSIEPVDAATVLGSALSMVHSARLDDGIRVDVEAGADIALAADGRRLQQVFVNLLSNACKYNRRGGSVRVTVHLDETGDPRGTPAVRVVIADTGIGIPADRIGRVFDPFDRLGREESPVEGSGIGLTLTRMILEQMGGSIRLESVEDEGTTVTVQLPSAARPPEPDMTGSGGGPAVVLGVEDNEASLLLLRHVVEREPDLGFLAATTVSGAIRLAREHRPDLILLDLHLADGNGEEVIWTLRESRSTRRIPVVVITADTDPGVMARVIGAGAIDFLPKPVSVNRLREVIRRVIPVRDLDA